MKPRSETLTRLMLTLVTLVAAACAPTPAPTPSLYGQAVVKELPAGVEGWELRDGALRLKEGYEFVPQPDGQFILISTGGGGGGTGGGCGCKGGSGKCEPKLKDGIAVCEADSTCTNCGLALTIDGRQVEIMRFAK